MLCTAVLGSDLLVGSSFWIRFLLGLTTTSLAGLLALSAGAACRAFPVPFVAAFVTMAVLQSWVTCDILSTVIILPYSADFVLTVAVSITAGVTIVLFATLLGLSVGRSSLQQGSVFVVMFLAGIGMISMAARIVRCSLDHPRGLPQGFHHPLQGGPIGCGPCSTAA